MHHMAYTTNPHLPRLRMEAVRLHQEKGWSVRQVARHLGYSHSAVVKWVKKAQDLPSSARLIPTQSSAPHHHPAQISEELIARVLQYRYTHHRCAQVIHHLMRNDGYEISLSAVKRVISRYCVTKNPYKKRHYSPPRPSVYAPGDLVQIDTIHRFPYPSRIYLYTCLDVFSRWAWACVAQQVTAAESVYRLGQAAEVSPFVFHCIQSDHGPEFGTHFTRSLHRTGYIHRHSRVRTPTDNGHLERFNRTLQEECLNRCARSPEAYQKALPDYLHYYNYERPHLGIELRSPIDMVPRS